MRNWYGRFSLAVVLSLALGAPALAQRVVQQPSAPCPGQPLKCIQTAPDVPLATAGVVRIFARYRYDDGSTAAGCGTGWLVDRQYTVAGQAVRTIVTNRHVVEGNDVNGHYVATDVQVEFFYIPQANRVCGVLANNECHINATDCSIPVPVQSICWDWDTQCDLARVYIKVADLPAGAAPLPLGANPVVGQSPWIPQHPQARCMEWDEGPVTEVSAGCDFSYNISTQGGSSGSPVIYQGLVVGVHRAANVDAGNNPVCPNIAVKVSELIRYLGTPPTQVLCSPTPVPASSWGKLKVLYR